ncbi:MAG TPA: hypothetical protein VJT73_06640 [Polyangiaceae bacterium]|nr:hypothetical protein [Polyangiaceae bacterium]
MAGTSTVVNAVKGDEFGIGYGGIAQTPTLETAQSSAYPISRFLYFYTAGEATGGARKFIDWVKGDAGQKIIGDVGYYPLPKG